jgi:cytochrome c oxidase subunit II
MDNELSLTIPAASEFAEQHDKLFHTINFLAVFFTIIVFVGLAVMIIIYKKGSKASRLQAPSHNSLLEAAWTIPPLVLGLAVFFWSAKLFASAYNPPKNAKEIFVIGKQWMWHMQHSNGIRENNELHLPLGEPIKLTMISQDVIHAFYVPEFRMQRMVEPGNYSVMWVTPSKPGRYHLFCNMYCGTQHSEMGGWVYVLPREEYNRWVASAARPVASGGYGSKLGGLSLAQQGRALYEKRDCGSCHEGSGPSQGRGPSLAKLYGQRRQLQSGQSVVADDAYLRNVLYYPNEYALAGWQQSMPSYKGTLSESDVLAINAYVKTIGVSPVGEVGAPSSDAPAADTTNQQWRFMYGGESYK